MKVTYREDIGYYQALHGYPSVVGDVEGYRVMQYEGYGDTHYQALLNCIANIATWNGQEIREEFGYDDRERSGIAIVDK